MSEGTALIYYATKTGRISPEELEHVQALITFARDHGWDVTGAVIEPDNDTPSPSRLWQEVEDDWDNDKIDAVIMWDAQVEHPTVWVDDLPNWLQR